MFLVTGGLDAASRHGRGARGREILVTRLRQEVANGLLGLRILAFAKVMGTNVPARIDEVVRRPVLVVEALPDRIVVIERHRIGDSQLRDGPAHIPQVLLEGKFGSVPPMITSP
jgi:hypothetical protein